MGGWWALPITAGLGEVTLSEVTLSGSAGAVPFPLPVFGSESESRAGSTHALCLCFCVCIFFKCLLFFIALMGLKKATTQSH